MTPSAQSYSRRAPAEVTCMLTCEPPQGPSAMTRVGLVIQPTAARLTTSTNAQASFLTFCPTRGDRLLVRLFPNPCGVPNAPNEPRLTDEIDNS